MPNVNIEPSWKELLEEYFETPEFENLVSFVKNEYQTKTIFPAPNKIFEAFWQTPLEKVKVIILGQDPYHGDNQAHGLSFSVPVRVKVPPSLQNIYKEIEKELNIKKDFTSGNLENWAKQGVFLLNSVLTVEKGKPASHQKIGWENFTDFVIQKLSDEKENLVFMFWGSFAKSKKVFINEDNHLILTAAHPSPFSAHNGFFGCNHFSKCNQFLAEKNLGIINW
jgi:uracil-DNA glycosylase